MRDNPQRVYGLIGVYAITNLVTGKVYIGSSSDVPRRWREHLSKLTNGNHPNDALQMDWSQYGGKAFSWSFVSECASRSDAIAAEQVHIDASTDLYNAARRAGSGPRDGFRHTDASRLKMADAMRGRPKSDTHRANIAAARRGKSNPTQAATLRGRKHSPEHCQKISLSNTGKKHTDEYKAHMRALMTGRDTSTWAWKMAATKRGQPWSAKRRAMFEAAKQSGVESKVG
jgi:group I intron endonuclease